MAEIQLTPPRQVARAVKAVELLDGFQLDGSPARVETSGWLLPIIVTGLLPSRIRNQQMSPNKIGDQEPVTFLFSDGNIDGAPRPYLRADFPEQIHHYTPNPLGLGPIPCISEEPLDEFHYSAGFVGILHQLRNWLLKAATGNLSNEKDGWEATPTPTASVLINAHNRLSTIDEPQRADGNSVYVIYRCAQFGSASAYSYDLSVEGVFDPAERHPNQGYVAGIHFHTSAEAAPISSNVNPAAIENAGDLAKFIALIGITEMEFAAKFTTLVSQARKFNITSPDGKAILVPVSLHLKRPYNLAGTESPLELFCFTIVWNALWDAERAATDFDSAEVLVGRLLSDGGGDTRARLSGCKSRHTFELAGVGSLGSKMGLSLCRAGWECTHAHDPDITLPHNSARYGLPIPLGTRVAKTKAFAAAIECIQTKAVITGDNVLSIDYSKSEEDSSPDFLINTTADTWVSGTLSNYSTDRLPSRIIDASLMLRGNLAVLVIEGRERAPNYHDLMSLVMLNITQVEGLGEALISDVGGYERIDVGGGCGAFTMVVSDARIDAMSGLMTEEILEFADNIEGSETPENGHGIIWFKQPDTGSTRKTCVSSGPFLIVPCTDSDWTVRISPEVEQIMACSQALSAGRETGGYLIGHVDERRKEISVVAIIPPPPGSTSSTTQITLGTTGVNELISIIAKKSGGYLMDVGTWHTHLSDVPPSPTDHQLVSDLSIEPRRLVPSVMIVRTPKQMHAVLADPIFPSDGAHNVA